MYISLDKIQVIVLLFRVIIINTTQTPMSNSNIRIVKGPQDPDLVYGECTF